MTPGKEGSRRSASAAIPQGRELLHNPTLNKGTAFTEDERDRLKLRGLLPPRVLTQDEQAIRVLENFRRKSSALEKYIFLSSLLDRNEKLFYRVVIDNIKEMMPIIYTPTVGEACKRFAHIYRHHRGLYISTRDKGRIASILRNWPEKDVRVIVLTDGERILGLGDLGANGMGIPIGKLALYTACAGIPPLAGLPILLDVGTSNEELLADPLYLGTLQHRLRGSSYDAMMDELVDAITKVFPGALLQFEDFGSTNAFRLLRAYRDRLCTFNDDIQGTGAVALAGLLSAMRITGGDLKHQTLLFQGAASAAIGIADLVVFALVQAGLSQAEAHRRCWLVDSKGLVVRSRDRLAEHKRPYAHDHEFCPDLHTAVEKLKPTALIGVSGQPRTFTKPVLQTMADLNERPIVFALSNPTSKAECTAEEACQWTRGTVVFAAGSPFGTVKYEGKTYVPGQGNNAYIFPGLGLGILACGARRVSDAMFLAAAEALAARTSPESLDKGLIYPPLRTIREVSACIAERVAEVAYDEDLATLPRPDDLPAMVRSLMYEPRYTLYV